MDSTIHNFEIAIPEEKLQLLQDKLKLSQLPDELSGAGWNLGPPLAEIKRLINYWQNGFNWRKQEKALNEGFSHFTTNIQARGFDPLKIHFIHQRSEVADAIPLLFVHGWPGSFFEGIKIIKALSQESGDDKVPAFHVVVPSLPNYGFSEGPKRKGFGIRQYAETMHKLMLRLGYTQYVCQGGDWGMVIIRLMARLYPENLKAYHLNMQFAEPPKFFSHPILWLQDRLPAAAAEIAGAKRQTWFRKEGFAYNKLHQTKPQTIGYALADSPVALLAWIYEKLHDWTDSYPWTDDEILTWISIYTFSTAGPWSSVRTYHEATHIGPDGDPTIDHKSQIPVPKVPLGLAYFPRDIEVFKKSWTRTMGPVVYESDHAKGGHFAAWECPDEIVFDLRSMFGKGGPCYGVVDGRKGYVRVAKL